MKTTRIARLVFGTILSLLFAAIILAATSSPVLAIVFGFGLFSLQFMPMELGILGENAPPPTKKKKKEGGEDDDDDDELTPDQIVKSINDAQEKVKEAIEKKADAETVLKLQQELDEFKTKSIKRLTDAVKAQGEKITVLEEGAGKRKEHLTRTAMILEKLTEKKDILKKMAVDGDGKLSFEIDYKTAQLVDLTNLTSGDDFAFMEPGVGQIPVRRPFMEDLFSSVNTESEFIKYLDQETVTRDAQNTIHCAVTNHNTDVEWEVKTLQMKKIRDYIDICQDMMEDYDFVEGEIRNLVESSAILKADEGLLLGDGTGNNLNGVSSVAGTFNAASVGADYSTAVDDPTTYDLICVVGAQISAFGAENKWFANWAIMNPKDAKLMRLAKDANNNYITPPFVTNNGQVVDGIGIVENPLVPENEMYVGDFRMGRIYNRKSVTVEMSFENNDNFQREIVTVKAWRRLNLRIRNVDANAFIHVPDIGAAITAITAP